VYQKVSENLESLFKVGLVGFILWELRGWIVYTVYLLGVWGTELFWPSVAIAIPFSIVYYGVVFYFYRRLQKIAKNKDYGREETREEG